jgi:hypothetical protein
VKTFLRSVLAIAAGFIVGGLFVAGIEALGHVAFPTPAGVDLKNPAVKRDLVASMPIGAVLSVLQGWIVGALAGAWVAAKIAAQWRIGHAAAIGALILAGAITAMLTIPHPAWMWIGALVGVPLAAYVGGRWAAGARTLLKRS